MRQRVIASGESREPLSPTRRMAEHIGYVTIFPLLLTLLEPRAHEFELRCLMEIMRDPKQVRCMVGGFLKFYKSAERLSGPFNP